MCSATFGLLSTQTCFMHKCRNGYFMMKETIRIIYVRDELRLVEDTRFCLSGAIPKWTRPPTASGLASTPLKLSELKMHDVKRTTSLFVSTVQNFQDVMYVQWEPLGIARTWLTIIASNCCT